MLLVDAGVPPVSWSEPAGAWRIILVGTASSDRGRGVAAQLYRSLMADRLPVARIAVDNAASIRLHHRSAGACIATAARRWRSTRRVRPYGKTG